MQPIKSRADKLIARIRSEHVANVEDVNRRFVASVNSWLKNGSCDDVSKQCEHELIVNTINISTENIDWAMDQMFHENIIVEQRGDEISFFHEDVFNARKNCGYNVHRLCFNDIHFDQKNAKSPSLIMNTYSGPEHKEYNSIKRRLEDLYEINSTSCVKNAAVYDDIAYIAESIESLANEFSRTRSSNINTSIKLSWALSVCVITVSVLIVGLHCG